MISHFQETQTTVPYPGTNREAFLKSRFTFLGSNMGKVGDGETVGWGKLNQNEGYTKKLSYIPAVTSAVGQQQHSAIQFSLHKLCHGHMIHALRQKVAVNMHLQNHKFRVARRDQSPVALAATLR